MEIEQEEVGNLQSLFQKKISLVLEKICAIYSDKVMQIE